MAALPFSHSRNPNGQAARFAQVGLQTQVGSASPTQLIGLLLAGACADVARAKLFFEQGDVAARGQAISHALSIVREGLIAALDTRQGEIAQQLRHHYEVTCYWLLRANREQSPEKLEHANKLLSDMRQIWQEATQGK